MRAFFFEISCSFPKGTGIFYIIWGERFFSETHDPWQRKSFSKARSLFHKFMFKLEETVMVDAYFGRFVLPEDLHEALLKCRSIAYIETQEELDELVFGPTHSSRYDVVYNIVGNGSVKEAEVIRCKNGASVNFMEDYMRRRI